MRKLGYLFFMMAMAALLVSPAMAKRKKGRVLSPGAYIKTAKIEILSGDLERYEYAIVMLDSLFMNYGPHAEGYYWMGQIMVDFINKTPDPAKKLDYVRKFVAYADSLEHTCADKKIKKKYRKGCKKFVEKTDSTKIFFWQKFYNQGVDELKDVDRILGDLKNQKDSASKELLHRDLTALADSCVKNMSVAIAVDSSDPQPFIALGSLYEKLDSVDQANEWMIRGLSKAKDRTKLLLPIAYNYIRKGDYCGAIPYFREYVDTKKDDLETVFNLSICYNNCKQYDSAKVMLEHILEVDTANVQAMSGIGDYFGELARRASDSARAYQDKGDEAARKKWLAKRDELADSAFAYYQHAFQLQPDKLKVVERFGLYAYLNGHYKEAVQAYSKAVEIKPDNAEDWITLGDSYINLKDFAKATAAYEKAAELEPTKAELWRQLVDLYDATKQPAKRDAAKKKLAELEKQ